MHATSNARRTSWAHSARTILAGLGSLALAAVVGLGAAGLFHAGAGATRAGVAAPANTTILHVRGARTEPGARAHPTVTLEAWLDEATNEGKIVQTTPDGAVFDIEAVDHGTYVHYLADARHAVIRNNIAPGSSSATRLRTELFLYQDAVGRGRGQIVGQGRIGARATNRVRLALDGQPVVGEVDQATGLALHEEFGPPGAGQQTRETTYGTVEHLSRASLAPGTFQVALPADAAREEYTERRGDELSSVPNGLPYAVYAAPPDAGTPTSAFHRTSLAPGVMPSDTYYLIYRTPDGEVQVLSGLPPDAAALQGKPGAPLRHPQRLSIGGIGWEAEAAGSGFQGSAQLGNTYVTIFAPNRAVFEHVAGALRLLGGQ